MLQQNELFHKYIFSHYIDDQLGNREKRNTMSFLERGLTIHAEKNLCVDGSEQDYLLFQVDEWLNKLFDGFDLISSNLQKLILLIYIIRKKEKNHMSAYRRGCECRFWDHTYVLPVLVALLT